MTQFSKGNVVYVIFGGEAVDPRHPEIHPGTIVDWSEFRPHDPRRTPGEFVRARIPGNGDGIYFIGRDRIFTDLSAAEHALALLVLGLR